MKVFDIDAETGEGVRDLPNNPRPILADYLQHAQPGGWRKRLRLIGMDNNGQATGFELVQGGNKR